MTLDQFFTNWNGKKCDFDGVYGGQCVDLFRQYVQDVLKYNQPRGVIGAADFWTNYETDPNLKNNFDKIPNTPDGIPQAGDIIIWKKNAANEYHGHISIVLAGATTSQFRSLDQNWRKLSVTEPITHNYNDVLGWFRPKVGPNVQPIAGTMSWELFKQFLGGVYAAMGWDTSEVLTDARKAAIIVNAESEGRIIGGTIKAAASMGLGDVGAFKEKVKAGFAEWVDKL